MSKIKFFMYLVLLIFPAYISFGDFIVKSEKIVFDFTQQDSSFLEDKIYYPIIIGEYNEDQTLHMIELKKENESLRAEINNLKGN